MQAQVCAKPFHALIGMLINSICSLGTQLPLNFLVFDHFPAPQPPAPKIKLVIYSIFIELFDSVHYAPYT